MAEQGVKSKKQEKQLAAWRECEVCGCTHTTPCIDDDGKPCHWVDDERCSSCEDVAKIIHFEDHGQDFLVWGIDEDGQVIYCAPFQSWIWNGKIVDLESLTVGTELYYTDEERELKSIKYPVERIKDLTNN